MEPILTKLFNSKIDFGEYENVRGNLPAYIVMLLLGWIIGGLFDEFYFRGYIFHRFGKLIKDERIFKVVSIFTTSTIFGIALSYQGVIGIIITFILTKIFGCWFYFMESMTQLV